jgi:predicted RNase H-like nuclease (RuvC/YqgF family)
MMSKRTDRAWDQSSAIYEANEKIESQAARIAELEAKLAELTEPTNSPLARALQSEQDTIAMYEAKLAEAEAVIEIYHADCSEVTACAVSDARRQAAEGSSR